jgi:hypothetical protein
MGNSSRAAFIEPALSGVWEKLPRENFLRGTDRKSFSRRRPQREFIRQLDFDAAFAIDWSRITRDRMIAASRISFQTGDSSALAALILGSTCQPHRAAA